MIPKLPYMFCNKSKYGLYRIGRPISVDSLTVRIPRTKDFSRIVTPLIILPLPFIYNTYFIYEKTYGFY